MTQRILAFLLIFVLVLSLAACGAGEETTLTGMVVAVDGTKVSLIEMDTENMGGMNFGGGEMPEGFDSENFDPEDFGGMVPGGEDFNPEDFEGMMPEGGDFAQWEEGERPEMPEGMTPPEDGEMQGFGGGMFSGSFASDEEATEVDISEAHISVEIDGGKASGSMEDIKAGTFVTITLNKKGKATNVLVSSVSGFGGGRGAAN